MTSIKDREWACMCDIGSYCPHIPNSVSYHEAHTAWVAYNLDRGFVIDAFQGKPTRHRIAYGFPKAAAT